MTAETLLSRLSGVRRTGPGRWLAKCPAHDDDKPSLSISQPNGKILLHCHAGCKQDDVIEALKSLGLWNGAENQGRKITAVYDYTDASGKLIFQVCRFEPKDFRQRRPDGKGDWIWNLKGIKSIPYNLPGVAKAVANSEKIVIVEGEKDVENLRKIGIIATTNAGGAGKWRSEYSRFFKGSCIVIIPDNDEPGQKHADKVAKYLANIAAQIKIVELPGLAPKGDVSDWLAAGGTREELLRMFEHAEERKSNSNDRSAVTERIVGAELLDAAHEYIGRFVAFPDAHALAAVTLWAAHAHMVEHLYTTPRLALLSPEPASGKTRVLEVLNLLVPESMFCLNASPAAIFRTLSKLTITLLVDECDAIFSSRGKDDSNEDLRALLNAGYKRGATIPRCVGPTHDVQSFAVHCATALAGLGDLPDTLMSRAVIIRMRRRGPNEYVEPFREREQAPAGHAIRDRIADWASVVGGRVGDAWPNLPLGIVDRAAEVWEPLIAIADAAGGHWPQTARAACLAMCSTTEQRVSLGIRLLGDLRTVFGDADALSTKAILARLCDGEHGLESDAPWGEIHGKPLGERGLATLLKRYGVASTKVKVDGRALQGYRRDALWDAWVRYLSPVSGKAEPVEPAERAGRGSGGLGSGQVPDECPEEGQAEPGNHDLRGKVPLVPEVPEIRTPERDDEWERL